MTQSSSLFRTENLCALPHHLLQLLEASHHSPPRKANILTLLHDDAALLALFLGYISHRQPLAQCTDESWLTDQISTLSYAELRLFALECCQPYLGKQASASELLALRALHGNAIRAAELTRLLAHHTGLADEHEARLCGMLHNVGKLSLLSRAPNRFLESGMGTDTAATDLPQEDHLFSDNHIDAAVRIIASWSLDSFIADAIAFQHEMADNSAPALLSLLHACLILCRQTEPSGAQTISIQNLHLNEKALHSLLFHWRELLKGKNWLEQDEQTFAAYQQEVILDLRQAYFRYSMIVCRNLSALRQTSEKELLEDSLQLLSPGDPSRALFFLLSADQRTLTGTPASGQPMRIHQLNVRLEPGISLVSQALINQEPLDTFSTEPFALGLLDKQLLRLWPGEGYACLPLIAGETLGTLVVAVRDEQERQRLDEPETSLLIEYIAEKLADIRACNHPASTVQDAGLLLGEISHEISTPLSTIQNYLYIIKRNADDESRNVLQKLDGETRRISEIIKNHRQRAQNATTESESLDINQLIRETVSRVVKNAGYDGEVKTELDNGTPIISSNPIILEQILTNLIGNACDATTHKGLIIISSKAGWQQNQQRFVEIRIEDNGPGIPDAIKRTLFRPTKSTKGPGHSGLGLSIVGKLVNQINGLISCLSDEKGTQFQILVPEFSIQTQQNNKRAL